MRNYTTDMHVHFYTNEDLKKCNQGPLPYALPQPYSLQTHLDRLISLGQFPYLIGHAYISILPDSQNILTSLNELEILKEKDPQKYGEIELIGFIKADPDYATEDLLNSKGIQGVRLVLHDTSPELIDETEYQSAPWKRLYEKLIQLNQHFLIYATDPATVLKVLNCLPDELKVSIDHLGNCKSTANNADYLALLTEAARRKNVYFKGPGYRTSIDPNEVLPYLQKIIEMVGYDKLLLGATDAPHVGSDLKGIPYSDSFPDTADIVGYSKRLLERLEKETQIDPLYFKLINACYAYEKPLPIELIPYSFDEKKCVMYQEATFFNVAEQSMQAQFYYPSDGNTSDPIFVHCSGFTGLEHIHPRRFARASTLQKHVCFSFDYRGFGRNVTLAELGRVRLTAQIEEIEASVEYVRQRYPNRSIVLNGWGMAGGLVIRAAVKLIQKGILVQGIVGINGLYDSEAIQHAVRGEDDYVTFCRWFDKQNAKRTEQDDPIDIDPFDVYPLAIETRKYVDDVLRKQPQYNDITKVDFEFARQLKSFKITKEELQLLKQAGIPIHIIHGSKNDIHPISQAENLCTMLENKNLSFTPMLDCNHTDFMQDDDPRYIEMMRTFHRWVDDNISKESIIFEDLNINPSEIDKTSLSH